MPYIAKNVEMNNPLPNFDLNNNSSQNKNQNQFNNYNNNNQANNNINNRNRIIIIIKIFMKYLIKKNSFLIKY